MSPPLRQAPRRRPLIYLALLLATLISVVFYLTNRAVDINRHNETVELLNRLKQMDTELDREVLQIKAFRLTNFDSLTTTRERILQLNARLTAPDYPLIGTFGPAFDAAAADYLKSSEQKLKQLERIKSVSAVVRTALRYLPGEIERVVRGVYPAQRPLLSEFAAKLFSYHVFADPDTAAEIIALDERLNRIEWPTSQQEAVAGIRHHVKATLSSLQRLSGLLDRYFALPAQRELESLYDRYADYYAGKSRNADLVAFALLLAVLLLLIGTAFSQRALERSRAATQLAWDKLRDAIESIGEGFALYDPHDRLVLWNTNFAALHDKFSQQLHSGLPFRRLIRLQLDKGLFAVEGSLERWYRQRLIAHKRGSRERLQRLRDGRALLISDYKTSEGGTATLFSDITARLATEQHLRQLSRAVEQSPASVLITDPSGCIEYVNRKFEEMTGYRTDEVLGKTPRLLKSGETTPELYRQLWETISAGGDWHGEMHNRRKDGTLYWESATISPLRDEHGKITHFVAVKEDITLRKLAEEQLHLAAAVFETTSEGIMVTDAQGRIVGVNPAFTRITGYSPAEAIGHNPRLLSSGYQDDAFYREMWSHLQRDARWAGEIWNRSKEGGVYPEWLSITAVRDEEGRLTHYVGVFSDITERKEAEERIRWQANYDALTRLPNRSLFFDRLSQVLANARREGWLVALLFLDLDRFKVINDTLGHAFGDQLLRQVAERLKPAVRETDTLARLGGDEFTLVLQDIRKESDAAAVAEHIIDTLAKPFQLGQSEAYIGVSVGIALYPGDAADGPTLLRNADLAMYKAKSAGRNRYHFFTQSMNEEILARNALEHDLHKAVERGELVTYFQPIIEARTGRLYGAEALIRWQHPERGLVPPGDFIPLAEECGLIGPIGEWVLWDACRNAAKWRADGAAPFQLSINLSNQQRKQGLNGQRLREILYETGFPPEHLTLELTESLLLEESDESLVWLDEIKSTGVTLSIDDFGTGYSSLSYLQRLPFDHLKIDRSFVTPLDNVERDDSLIKAILAIARTLNMKAVAEGVETERQFRYLQEHHCDLLQGFYFSRPLPETEFLALLHRPA